MTAMNELESVKRSLEQIAKSNAESAAWRAKSDAWRAKADAWRAVADERHAEAEAARESAEREIKETAKEVRKAIKMAQETTRVARETSRIVGGMGQTQGRVTEEFFYDALRKTRRLGDIKFDYVYPNVKGFQRNDHAEYDLLLLNDEMVAVIEVKHKLRRDDVERMRDVTLPGFRYFLPDYKDKTLAPGMACMTADEDAIALAHKCGYAVLLPNGRQVRADVSHLRCLPKPEVQ